MDSPNFEPTQEFLTEMKKLVILTKRLSEFHINNLKNFPVIAFEGIERVSIDYDLKSTPGHISYTIETKKKRFKNRQKRLEDIRAWARSLLWKEIDVKITLNGKPTLWAEMKEPRQVMKKR